LREAAANSPLRAEFDALVTAQVGAGDVRWLDLYVRACRYRECIAMVGTLESAEARAAFEQELAALVTSKAPAEDPRWDQLRARAVQAGELDHQFATLQFDIQQHAVLDRTTGERAWNGTTYAIPPTSCCGGRRRCWPI
jgi:hypothetical protein